MKTVNKENLLEELREFEKRNPIKMAKVISNSFWYGSLLDYKTVDTLEEALELGRNGWFWVTNQNWYFQNISLNCYRTVQSLISQKEKICQKKRSNKK